MPNTNRDRRIVWSAGVGVFQRLVQVASTLVLMPLLLRALGPARFGIWGAASSLAWLTTLLDIGTGAALVTLVARSSASEDSEQSRTHIAGALGFGCSLAAILLAASLLAWALLGSRGNSPVYLIAVIGLALNVPLNAANNVWMALQKGYVAGFWELMQTLVTLVGLIVAVTVTSNVTLLVGVVYLGLILSNLGSLVHLLLRHPELRPELFHYSFSAMKAVAGEGLMYFALGIAGGLSFFLDNILALELLGPGASAQMTIAIRICMGALGVLLVISQPLWPAFVEASHKSDHRWVRKTLFQGSALLVGITAAGSAVLVLYGDRLLRLWLHTDLGIGKSLLWAVSVWVLAQALLRVPSLLLNALSVIRFQILVFFTASLIALALKLALASTLGVTGILSSTTFVVLVIAVPASIWRIGTWEKTAARQERGHLAIAEMQDK